MDKDLRDFSKARSSSCNWNVVKVVRFLRCFFFEFDFVGEQSLLSLSSSNSSISSSEDALIFLIVNASLSSLLRRIVLSIPKRFNSAFIGRINHRYLLFEEDDSWTWRFLWSNFSNGNRCGGYKWDGWWWWCKFLIPKIASMEWIAFKSSAVGETMDIDVLCVPFFIRFLELYVCVCVFVKWWRWW